nr:glycosyltransferase [Methanosarcina barkeri]
MSCGFKRSKGDIVITLDGDLQDDPKEIPRFIEKLKKV